MDFFLISCTACNIFIFFPPVLFLNTNLSFPHLYAGGWFTRGHTRKKSLAERSGDIGGHYVSSWPPIHLLVTFSFNHRRIIGLNMEVQILLKPDTWQRC